MMVIYLSYFLEDVDIAMAGSESELSIILPIMALETQRDKTSVAKDIEDMLRKEIEKSTNITSVDVINILFGINSSDGKSNYYSYV